MNNFERMLEKEYFDWKDIIIFMLDDYGREMAEKLIQDGILEELSEDGKIEFVAFLEENVRRAIGK